MEQEGDNANALLLAVRDHRDKAAFGALFDMFAPRLKGLFMRNGLDGSAAEDLAQDTLMTVWRKAAQFDPARGEAAAWIFRIARNAMIDRSRRNRGPVMEWVDDYDGDDGAAPAGDAMAAAQEATLLRSALRALPEGQRAMIESAYFGDMSHQQIQSATGLPLGTIKSRIRLGLERLRHELKALNER